MPFIEHLIRVTLCANESKSLIVVFFFLKKYSTKLLSEGIFESDHLLSANTVSLPNVEPQSWLP